MITNSSILAGIGRGCVRHVLEETEWSIGGRRTGPFGRRLAGGDRGCGGGWWRTVTVAPREGGGRRRGARAAAAHPEPEGAHGEAGGGRTAARRSTAARSEAGEERRRARRRGPPGSIPPVGRSSTARRRWWCAPFGLGTAGTTRRCGGRRRTGRSSAQAGGARVRVPRGEERGEGEHGVGGPP